MNAVRSLPRRFLLASLLGAIALAGVPADARAQLQIDEPRPMNFLDMQMLRSAGSYAPSPDGSLMLYTVRTPDWQEEDSQTDVHIVSITEGASSARQLTYTGESNESSPTWSPDGDYFLFLSNRDAEGGEDGNQIYMMRPDGGESQKVTDAEGGVSNFDFSPNGQWLVYRSGQDDERELYRMATSDLPGGESEQLTDTPAGVQSWEWAPGSDRIYYTTPDELDEAEKRRRELDFTVDIYNMETPLVSLWAVDLAPRSSSALASDPSYTVSNFTLSDDGAWIAFTGISSERYERNITEQGINGDLYLMETATGQIERLTDNEEVSESGVSFSPDSRWIAFTAPDNMEEYSFDSRRVYLREAADRGGDFRKLGTEHPDHVTTGFWSEDGSTIYFNTGVRATRQLLALDVASGSVSQVTDLAASLSVSVDDESGVVMVNYQDGMTPSTLFAAPSIDRVADQSSWTQLTDVNPEVRSLQLGEQEEITWRSTDGTDVGGVLIKPVGYQEGQRYPLIVAIHGGPASADVLSFNGGYGSQVYAGAGYVVLRPNYRGSTNYGEEFRTDIVGDYFPQAYEDIMAGVDHLIDEGLVDGDQMGVLGWSAGGHWSNWILTQTDRFKGISSGAGTSNWISMYAQSDVQRNRMFYLGNEPMYENFDPYWDQSPLKYIANATTPTMIHVVKGDPRVPSPQSVELHMALKKLGVPTELFMYPGESHGIPNPRNRLVKSVSEMAWMDYYVRGIGDKFDWESVISTLEEQAKPRPTMEGEGG